MDMSGRVALVTGAARRIGRAIAVRLARAGCRVAIHCHHSLDDAEDTAAECRRLAGDAAVFAADLSDAASCASLPPAVADHFGRLDILVNNASVFEPMELDAFDLAAWQRTLQVNVTAPMILTHAARAHLRAGHGRVVNLCDAAAADRPWPTHVAYMTSKGALESLTGVLARAMAPEVNVVGVAVGVAAWPEDYDAATRERLTRRIPLRRAGTPRDVAAVVHFLLTEGDYISGAIIPVDGGRRLV